MNAWILDRLHIEVCDAIATGILEADKGDEWLATIRAAGAGHAFSVGQVGRLLDAQGPDHWSRKAGL